MGQATQTIASTLSERQTKAWRYLEYDPTAEEIFFGGAAGPGKTWLGCLWKIYRRAKYPETRGITGRDQFVDLRDSTLQTFFECWTKFGQFNPLGVTGRYNANDKIFHFSNGSAEFFRHLAYEPSDPDYHRLGSTEFTDGFVDEMPECSERGIEILNSRIRYKLIGDVPKFLGCGNPSNNWVKHRYIKDVEGKMVELRPYQRLVKAKLSDNPDKAFRDAYKRQLEKMSHYDRRRLLYGDWDAVAREGGEAFYSFNPEVQVTDVPFLTNIPVAHLSFDQNVVPYITLLCAQVQYKVDGCLQIRIYKEYCLKHPRNKTQSVCEAFFLDNADRVNEVFIYGDASGNRRDTRAAISDYDIAQNVLRSKVSSRSYRVQRSNPEIRKRVLFLCAIFEGRIEGAEILIDRNCYNLINDLLYIKQDANGGKVKQASVENGVRFEQYGHTSDALEYLITTVLEKQFHDFERLLK